MRTFSWLLEIEVKIGLPRREKLQYWRDQLSKHFSIKIELCSPCTGYFKLSYLNPLPAEFLKGI
jgi:hypothetical protein